jgi:hypothetical protein
VKLILISELKGVEVIRAEFDPIFDAPGSRPHMLVRGEGSSLEIFFPKTHVSGVGTGDPLASLYVKCLIRRLPEKQARKKKKP